MADETPDVSVPVPASTQPHPIDWPSLVGVASIAGIAIIGLLVMKVDAKDIAIASVSALAGWMSHKAVAA